MTVFYWVVKAVLGPFLRIVFRPWFEGSQNVPREGPAILASNHLSFSDHFFAPLPIPRKVVFLAKSEYFTGRGLKGLISKAFFSGVGQIPVDRSGGEASERALRTGLRVLAQGEILGIYPEGTRTPDGRLYRGKTGVARLALEARAPVVPTAMIGGFEFQPPGKIAPRLRIRPGVRFGKPLDFSRYYGMEEDHIVLRAMTDEIMYELMKLSGQEYVDKYAQRSKGKGRRPALRKAAPAPAPAEAAAPAPTAAPTAAPAPVPHSPAQPAEPPFPPLPPGQPAESAEQPAPAIPVAPRAPATPVGDPPRPE
jgi:1-acyl-sn-glycerol-3-phosphate acyltransferase